VVTLFSVLEEENIGYCILAGYDTLPDNLQSDIDFMVSNEDFIRLGALVTEVARRTQTQFVQSLNHEISACSFVIARVSEGNVEGLRLDPCSDYRRHGRIWLKASEILARRRKHPRGFWVPAPADAFAYYLIKRIDKRSFNSGHGEYLSGLYREDPAGCDAAIARLWSPQAAAQLARAASECLWDQVVGDTSFFAGDLNRHSKPDRGKGYWVRECGRRFSRFIQPTGVVVAFLGPDGVGKSSVIDGVQRGLRECFSRTDLFHFRPALLRGTVAGREFTATPHGKPNRATAGSFAKLLFLWLDYVLGYWVRVRPLLVRSSLVIFDRYFDDAIADPRRLRYGGPAWLTKLAARCIPSPHLLLILDAPAEVIHARKQELEVAVIEGRRAAYAQIAHGARSRVARVIDASQPLEQVRAQAWNEVLAYMENRTHQRLHIGSQE
jgi:thymidylate kinase